MIVVKLSETKALVAESRRSTKYDTLTKEGLLVYLVDTSINTGLGPIKVLPINTNDESKLYNILGIGESITYSYVNVTLVSSGSDLDNVKIDISGNGSILIGNKIIFLLIIAINYSF